MLTSHTNSQPIDPQHLEVLVRHIFPAGPSSVERVLEGVSTYVYRVFYQRETFYLRILPEVGANFAPEAVVHTRLRQLQVRVPEVVYVEPCKDLLQRSV